jgi:hypothetical protein
MMKKISKAELHGMALAEVAMLAGHNSYNAQRGRKIVATCIKILQERIEEIQPKEASPAYKKARYSKK